MAKAQAIALAVCLAIAPMSISKADPADEGSTLSLENAFRGLWEKLGPELEDLRREMEPALEDALKLIEPFSAMDDPRHYRLPEVLPNGDIIIRRRDDAPDFVPPDRRDPVPELDGSIKT